MTKDGNAILNLGDILEKHGLAAGLAFLNERVPHRFTSIYRLEDDRLNRVAFFDKLGSSGHDLVHAPFRQSLCEVAVQAGILIEATDITSDVRFRTLSNPGKFGSYVGLPLASARGELFGTLCHADPSPQALADAEFHFLNEGAKVIAGYLEQIFPPGRQALPS